MRQPVLVVVLEFRDLNLVEWKRLSLALRGWCSMVVLAVLVRRIDFHVRLATSCPCAS